MSVTDTRLDVESARRDFPILWREVHGRPLVYLDNAATTQKPRQVIEALSRYYGTTNANVHRGVHALSQAATEQYEAARIAVQRFLGAERKEEIVFVRGCTEAINLVAASWGRTNLSEGDEILLTEMEHHSNIVPWQLIADATRSKIVVVPVTDRGELDLDVLDRLLGSRTKIVAVTHVSNALGTINPVQQIIERAHAVGAKVLVDGAQAAPHVRIDVRALNADFYAISGHKVYGPTGIGALYAKYELLQSMPPYQGGGDMIRRVSFAGTTYAEPPSKFEAGTPDIAGAVGFKAALDYVEAMGFDALASYERDLLEYAETELRATPGLRVFGTAEHKCGVVSFLVDDIHPHDLGTILDLEGVAIRAGHHCAQPLMDRFGVAATARASFALYNTRNEVDALVAAIHKAKELFH